MAMLVVRIGYMRVRVPEATVPMCMSVWFARGILGAMFMSMMFVVHMRMGVPRDHARAREAR